jgi:pyruvate dehydrogenase E2 component (dihydrolipoamide acetyltransferase)
MGMTMEEGTIIAWLKQPGDVVAEGEPVLEIETDKVTLAVQAPESGIMGPLLVAPNDIVPVGYLLSYILQEGETAPEIVPEEKTAPVTETPLASSPPTVESPVLEKRVKSSPRARRLADELGIDIATVTPTKGRRILEADVRKAAEAQSELSGKITPLKGIRKVVAERMAHSFQTVPHIYLTVETEAQALLSWHEQLSQAATEEAGIEPTITDLLLKIVGQALNDHPAVNSAWTEQGIEQHGSVNVGIATDTENGLVVPVVKQVDAKSLDDIVQDRQRLVETARQGKLALPDLEGGTFTISNLGMFGIDDFDPIINSPQSAILAVGRIKERPVVENGQVLARPTMMLTLAADHRVIDGAAAARFMARIDELMRDPDPLRS